MTGVHVIKKDPEGGTGTLYWRETSVDTALFPLGKIDGSCKQINYAESIANTCHFQFNANLFLTLPLRRLGCMPGSECMFRLLQGRKGALYMLHRGSCPQDYWFPTRGFTELHISVHHSESQVCFFFFFIHLFEDIQYPEPWNKIAVSVLDGSGPPDAFAQNMRFLLGLLILAYFSHWNTSNILPRMSFLPPQVRVGSSSASISHSCQPLLQVTVACLPISRPLQTLWSVGVRITLSSSYCYPQYQGQCLSHSVTQHMSKWRHLSS